MLRTVREATCPASSIVERYHVTVCRTASPTSYAGCQPSWERALVQSNRRMPASLRACVAVAVSNRAAPPHAWHTWLTSCSTGTALSGSGPKFHAPPYHAESRASRAPSHRYPDSGSRTCCHGRTEPGLRTTIGLPSISARMQSGTRRSAAQSPPPMTLPDRTEATPVLFPTAFPASKNDDRYEATTISAAALLALYGSCPPSASASR